MQEFHKRVGHKVGWLVLAVGGARQARIDRCTDVTFAKDRGRP